MAAVHDSPRPWAQAPPAAPWACGVVLPRANVPRLAERRSSDLAAHVRRVLVHRWRSTLQSSSSCWIRSTANASPTRRHRPCMPRCSTKVGLQQLPAVVHQY